MQLDHNKIQKTEQSLHTYNTGYYEPSREDLEPAYCFILNFYSKINELPLRHIGSKFKAREDHSNSLITGRRQHHMSAGSDTCENAARRCKYCHHEPLDPHVELHEE